MAFNFHDDDLVPIDATPAERERIITDCKQALKDTGLVVPMATTNLFTDPSFKDGAFTSNDPQVRAYALQKAMRGIDMGVDLGAKPVRVLGRTRRHGDRQQQKRPRCHQTDARRPQFPV